ncbi:PREDICTED: TPR repeat-containing thioredoxin TTL1 [Ipomoea nil]|uniref:TPR repeat-containing thioredoxin TTL1 n=1 Tax=Ipomoea nil TaxID=35883 RepID=UPI000900A7C4|nr:PREDICTED: TPR repeat-containing thioredoxin TTL1 [Ipomoea nil]XP_019152336.1 PREDICTED: TPR repeat-containing thioredoxin TTL1 [Ipomoea nil]
MAPAATEEWSVQNDMGCGLVGALFQRGGSKPSKSPPSPRTPAAKNQITVDARRRRRSSSETNSNGGGDHRQRTPRSTTTMPPPPTQVANLAYTQRLRREPTFTSSELSVTIVGHRKSSAAATAAAGSGESLYRASSGNVMLPGHLGNLNQKPSKQKERPNGKVLGSHLGATAMMGNIFRHSSLKTMLTGLDKSMNPDALKSMGNQHYKQGRYEEALNLYNEAIAINPRNPCFHSNKSAALMALSRPIEAVFECREAIRLDPFYHNAQYRLANLYFRLGEAEKAVCHYEKSGRKADGKDIDQAKALSIILGSCSEAQRVKDWASLLKQSQSALSLGSDSSPQILAMKAEALMKLQRHEEAYTALVKWPAFNTEQCTSLFGSAKTAYFLGVKAQVLMAIGRFEDAVSGAKQAALLDRSSEQNALLVKKMAAVAAARSSANDLFKASKFAEAAAMNTQGLGYDPCNAVLLYNRAACRFKLGLFEKALEDCTAALNLRPSYRKARTRRADCNIKLERWVAAIQDCEVLIQETPGDEAVRRLFSAAKQRLDRQRQVDYGHRLQLRPRSDLVLVS